MKLIITLDVGQELNPGTGSHLAAIITNVNNKYTVEYKKELWRHTPKNK